ncbi:MAG: DUF3253 domain-containing protein [Rhodospirillum sp.]|nr:DUF3253 domain-containing protein [Rhodospirillum sp.]MCF8491734.1 DUF3253 domain-containing protein [Rhodospirillum sp.]MCF8499445.1 DUF3253 domain-containing protein [Rhodospirillum sp.]
MPRPMPPAVLIREAIEAFRDRLEEGKTFCPSDVVRHLVTDRTEWEEDTHAWRKVLPAVRRTALEMARDGQVTIYRKGKPVEPDGVKGVIRLGGIRDRPTELQ